MIDSCGIINKPPPHGPPPGFEGGQARWELVQWHNNLAAEQAAGAKPIALHDCHVGCASNFGGPTLAVAPCDIGDPAQQWALDLNPAKLSNYTSLVNLKNGFCAGCGSNPMTGCGNNAKHYPNGSAAGAGLGLQACLTGHTNQGAPVAPSNQLRAMGTANQLFNISANGTIRMQGPSSTSVGSCLGRVLGGVQIVEGFGPLEYCDQGWTVSPVPSHGTAVQIKHAPSPGMCLTSNGVVVEPAEDPWCAANNNMWRSNTDVLQEWTRIMVEVESVATQAKLSKPGAFSFPDCLELGVPGYGSLTWTESQSVLALFAVTSSPLLLGNDARAGRMQDRLVQLVANKDVIAVDQFYSTTEQHAGGRLLSWPVGKELWGKPLQPGVAAVVLLNRYGTAVGNFMNPSLPDGGIPPAFAPFPGCYITEPHDSLASPCDTNATRSSGEQEMVLNYSAVPRSWLGLHAAPAPTSAGTAGPATISCDVFDIYATASAGASLGTHANGMWTAAVPAHGVRFLRLENCTENVD